MNYMNKIDAWLEELLGSVEPGVEITDAKKAIKEKILESYRNGQRSGRSEKKTEPSE